MKRKASIHSYPHRRIASVFIAMGILVLLSAVIINPWAGALYRRSIVNYQDVMLGYFLWAIAIGLLIVGIALAVRISSSKRLGRIVLLFTTFLLLLLSDRLLLVAYGLPLWMADMKNHYRHRPNTIRAWGRQYDRRLIRTNTYGHHDDDFPMAKGDNEFRGLILGDSITMGHGLTYEDTFSNQLEDILREKTGRYKSYQIINTGVQGYSTFQEYNVLLESLVFGPDFVALADALPET